MKLFFGITQFILLSVLLGATAYAETNVNLEIAVSKDGTSTQFWMEAIRNRVSPDAFLVISNRKKKLSPQEKAWIVHIRNVLPSFQKTLPQLNIPFESIGPLNAVTVVLGNQGGSDGFTCSLEHICLDLSQWVASYGQPITPEDADRTVRILSHEYTHLLTKLHLGIHPYNPTTNLERAFLDLYVEGLGHFYSLSQKWVSSNGDLTDQAKDQIQQLETELVDRLLTLKKNEQIKYAQMTEGMNDGSFEKKWGALPVSLWLSKETGRDPSKLQSWVNRGPQGIFDLIQASVTDELHPKVMDLLENGGQPKMALAAKYEGFVFFGVAGLILILVLGVTFWHGSLVFSLRRRLKKPELLTVVDKLHDLLIPSLFSLSVICALLFIVLGVGHFALVEILGKWFEYDRATFVTIQAGTMAILFPLVILILDSSDDSHSLVVSKREVLLRHAHAFPIGLTLLIFSIYFIFDGTPLLATFTTVTCVALSLWALYRLLEITFSYEVAKEAEEKILAARVHHIAADDLSERISYKQTEKAIKGLGGPIDFEHHIGVWLEDRGDLDLIKIETKQDGLVSSISLKRLQKAVRLLESLLSSPDAPKPNPQSNTSFRIGISAYPGKVLNDREGRELATIVLPQGYGSNEFRLRLRELVSKSIKVSTLRNKRSAALDTLMTKLGQSGRTAVREDNLDLMNSIKETYELLYISISNQLEKHKAKLDGIEDPRTSRTFGGKTSNPFESLINQLMQLQRDVTGKKDIDDQILDRAIYIPHSLAYEALSRGDAKAYGSVLGVADVQLGSSVYNKAEPRVRVAVIEWLSGILKYKLLNRRRKKLKSKIDDEQMELARWTVIRLQTAARFSLDANDIESCKLAIKKIKELLDPYKHDSYEHSIEMLQWQLENSELSVADRAKAVEELERQQAAKMTEETLRRWYEISLIAIAGYALQCLDGVNHQQATTKENAEEILKYCIARLPSSFKEIFELQLFEVEHGDPDKWGWGMWESHPRNQVFHPHTKSYIQRIFALLFYRSASNISDKFKPSSYELSTQLAWPFRKDEHGIRTLVGKAFESVEGKTVAAQEVSNEQMEKMFSLFDEVEREAKLQIDLRVVNQELIPEKIEALKKEFVETFKEKAIFRRLLQWSKVNDKKEHGIGYYHAIYRDALIAEPNVGCSGDGGHYGESMASSEDQVTFDKVIKSIPESNKDKTIAEAVKSLLSKNVKADSIRIFVTYSVHRKVLNKDTNFIPKFRLRDRELSNFVIGIYVIDGIEIPVVEIMVRSPDISRGWFVCALDQIRLRIFNQTSDDLLPELHIYLQVRDPIHHEELKKELLETKKDEFEGVDPQLIPKLIGRKVHLNIFEGIEVNVCDSNLLYGQLVDDTQDE